MPKSPKVMLEVYNQKDAGRDVKPTAIIEEPIMARLHLSDGNICVFRFKLMGDEITIRPSTDTEGCHINVLNADGKMVALKIAKD